MVIFAISGSLRSESSYTLILNTMKSLAPAGTEFIMYDSLGSLPYFNPDFDLEKAPNSVKELRGMLNRSSAVIISTPEYAHGIPGSLKNALDWVASTRLLADKPVGIIMNSSSDSNHARDSLIETLKTMHAQVNSELAMTISGEQSKIDDPSTWQELKNFLENLILSTRLKS